MSLVFFRGADLSALVREAAITYLKERMKLQHLVTAAHKDETVLEPQPIVDVCEIEMKHFVKALAKLKPSVSLKVKRYI